MGEAKRRGDYAKRKAEVITAGRVKVERKRESRLLTSVKPANTIAHDAFVRTVFWHQN